MDLPTSLSSLARIVWPTTPKIVGDEPIVADDVDIVTAFFDIGRDRWIALSRNAPAFRRSVDDYFGMFANLAKLPNKMIIFTQPEFAERALAARRECGLEDRTVIVVFDDLFGSALVAPVRAAIAKRMTHHFQRWVTRPESPEYREPNYILVNALKSAFVCTALELGLLEAPQAAWVDFGYCRDEAALDASDRWRFDARGKMNLFQMLQLDATPISRVVRHGAVYFQGGGIVGPVSEWPWFADRISRALSALLACDLVDDDQTLILMVWREYPERFEIHPCSSDDWRQLLRRFRTGVAVAPVQLRRGPRVRSESGLMEELRLEAKRVERWFKSKVRRRVRIPSRSAPQVQ